MYVLVVRPHSPSYYMADWNLGDQWAGYPNRAESYEGRRAHDSQVNIF